MMDASTNVAWLCYATSSTANDQGIVDEGGGSANSGNSVSSWNGSGGVDIVSESSEQRFPTFVKVKNFTITTGAGVYVYDSNGMKPPN